MITLHAEGKQCRPCGAWRSLEGLNPRLVLRSGPPGVPIAASRPTATLACTSYTLWVPAAATQRALVRVSSAQGRVWVPTEPFPRWGWGTLSSDGMVLVTFTVEENLLGPKDRGKYLKTKNSE